jgi:hypothetical protein
MRKQHPEPAKKKSFTVTVDQDTFEWISQQGKSSNKVVNEALSLARERGQMLDALSAKYDERTRKALADADAERVMSTNTLLERLAATSRKKRPA